VRRLEREQHVAALARLLRETQTDPQTKAAA
jgi:hypothetical protein